MWTLYNNNLFELLIIFQWNASNADAWFCERYKFYGEPYGMHVQRRHCLLSDLIVHQSVSILTLILNTLKSHTLSDKLVDCSANRYRLAVWMMRWFCCGNNVDIHRCHCCICFIVLYFTVSSIHFLHKFNISSLSSILLIGNCLFPTSTHENRHLLINGQNPTATVLGKFFMHEKEVETVLFCLFGNCWIRHWHICISTQFVWTVASCKHKDGKLFQMIGKATKTQFLANLLHCSPIFVTLKQNPFSRRSFSTRPSATLCIPLMIS